MSTIKALDNNDIYYTYDTVANAKGTIVFSHGFVEYGAHYSKLASMFHKHGYNVFKYDVRGHGRSSAPLGDVERYDDFTDDLNQCVLWVQEQDSTIPIFTMGFSLGGMITALYGLMYPYASQGQILLGPGLKPQPQFMHIDKDSLSIHEFLEAMGTAGDAGIKQLVAMDSPYVLKKASRRFMEEALYKGQTFIWENTSMYQNDILIMHGQKDPIIDVQGSKDFYDAIGSQDKTLRIFPDYEHDLLRIRDAQLVVDEICQWCDKHL